MISIVVAGGGTAGHIEPALAVAQAFHVECPQATVTALGTPKGLESSLVPSRGFPLELIPAVPLPRKLSRELLTVPYRLGEAVRTALRIFEKVDADALVGFGGYVALPAYLAARKRNMPIVVHEANVKPGLANRIGAKMADRVFTASAHSTLRKAEPAGIPVRTEITQLERAKLQNTARSYFGLNPELPVLLVFGGSQGARAVNEAVTGAAPTITSSGIQILHAKGPRQVLSREPITGHTVVDYLSRMDLAYAAADLVVCRSGAMTVAEVSAVGLPAIFIPLAHGNGEQALNALDIVDAGGGTLLPEADLTAERLGTLVCDLFSSLDTLATMSLAARRAGSHDAATIIVRAVLELLEGSPRA